MNTSYKELILQDVQALVEHMGSLEKVWGDKLEVARKVQLYYYECEIFERKTGVVCWWTTICRLNSGASVQYSAYVEKGSKLTHRSVDLVGLIDEDEMEYDREIIDTEKPLCDILTGRLGDWLMANIVSTFLMD